MASIGQTYLRGIEQIKSNEVTDALKSFQHAEKKFKADTDITLKLAVLINISECLYQIERETEAIKYLDEIITHFRSTEIPTIDRQLIEIEFTAYFNLAGIYFHQEDKIQEAYDLYDFFYKNLKRYNATSDIEISVAEHVGHQRQLCLNILKEKQ